MPSQTEKKRSKSPARKGSQGSAVKQAMVHQPAFVTPSLAVVVFVAVVGAVCASCLPTLEALDAVATRER